MNQVQAYIKSLLGLLALFLISGCISFSEDDQQMSNELMEPAVDIIPQAENKENQPVQDTVITNLINSIRSDKSIENTDLLVFACENLYDFKSLNLDYFDLDINFNSEGGEN